MSRPGGQDDHVTGAQFEGLALWTAEHHVRAPAGDAEHFVGGRVEVVEREDAVAPGAEPAVAGEQLLVRGGAASVPSASW